MLYTFRHHNLRIHQIFQQQLQALHTESSYSCSFTTLSNLLQGRISRPHLLQIHAQVFRFHAHQDNLIATRLIGHYPSHVSLRIFNQLQDPNLFPFNAIIRVFADEGRYHQSLSLFKRLKRRLLSPNGLTFSFILKACFGSKNSSLAAQMHTQILKFGFVNDPFVCNGLLAIYAKSLTDLVSTCMLFDEMPNKGLVCYWTFLIAGFAQLGDFKEVLRLFCLMVKKEILYDIDEDDDARTIGDDLFSSILHIRVKELAILAKKMGKYKEE